MSIQSTKIEIIKKLLFTEDEEKLRQVKELLEQEAQNLTDEQTKVLNERLEKYEKGEMKFSPWEEVEKRIRKKK